MSRARFGYTLRVWLESVVTTNLRRRTHSKLSSRISRWTRFGFSIPTGRLLGRGRVRVIVRRAAKRAGAADAVSPHCLRHAHASHALDHGAPIHLVQATLGHSSVATTSSYLPARPVDSSARLLALERFSPEPSRIRLPLSRLRSDSVTYLKRVHISQRRTREGRRFGSEARRQRANTTPSLREL